MEQQVPEMYSVALAGGNKATLGLRKIPVTTADWEKIKAFLELLKDSVVRDDASDSVMETVPPPAVGNAGRILHGHIPSESEMATAAERIALRDNIKWANQASQDSRLQQLREKRAATKSSSESEPDSQS